jgi:hypothetical protein
MPRIIRGEIILAETQPTLREPDTRHAPDGGGAFANCPLTTILILV